jgi:hypothetical protein
MSEGRMPQEAINTIHQLKQLVEDTSLPVEERRTALRHILEIKADHPGAAVADIPDDDLADLANLMAPIADAWVADLIALTDDYAFMVNGRDLAASMEYLRKRSRIRQLLAVIVDESESKDERLVAIRELCKPDTLDGVYGPGGFASQSQNLSPEKLLEKVLPPTTIRQRGTAGNIHYAPVDRPPMELLDVWSFPINP